MRKNIAYCKVCAEEGLRLYWTVSIKFHEVNLTYLLSTRKKTFLGLRMLVFLTIIGLKAKKIWYQHYSLKTEYVQRYSQIKQWQEILNLSI